MTRLTQIFTVHPVGQGLFYSGIIKTKINSQERTFRMVFDCGTVTSNVGQEEVDRFRSEYFSVESDRLDLLVISHFDADHVNLIKKLLSTNRKVDKIVMPFIEFEERFFLVLRYLQNKNRGILDNDDMGTIRFILNPLNELRPHLDDDDETTVYLITSDPDSPAGTEQTGESSGRNTTENPELEFGFGNLEEPLNYEEINSFRDLGATGDGKVKKIKDSNIGDIHFKNESWIAIMEFAFYRRQATGKEKNFYKEVFDAFCNHYKIDKDEEALTDKIIENLKNIKGATIIKKFYREAKLKCVGIKIEKRDILNMNTTALCMLHQNLEKIHAVFGKEYYDNYLFDFNINRIEKIDSISQTLSPIQYYHLLNNRENESIKPFPNIVLTSDTYLKTPEEVDAFFNKYRNYQGNYWLFQVPHHGSKNNSDRQLFTRLPYNVTKFINYGVKHHFQHPDKELTAELIASGHAHAVLAITEFAGVSFEYKLGRN